MGHSEPARLRRVFRGQGPRGWSAPTGRAARSAATQDPGRGLPEIFLILVMHNAH